MAIASVTCNTGFLKSPEILGAYSGNTKSNHKLPILGFYNCSNIQFEPSLNRFNRLSLLELNRCCSSIPRLSCRSEVGGFEGTYLGKKPNGRKFSLRLRPRLRLLVWRMKRVSITSLLDEFVTFLRKNAKQVSISISVSVVLGLCFLFLKVTSSPSPKVVPYSDLIDSLQSGDVTKVLFEEGSRRVFYNRAAVENQNQISAADERNVVEDSVEVRKAVNLVLPKRLTKKQSSYPEWQYSTRKIVNDEKFLLSLMRDKGITYSSAPQSVLMSIRGTLITILTLWIPLSPMMWLLYRQFSSANSPARKRRTNDQIVGFDDVEGVDAAKVELMEVIFSFSICLILRFWCDRAYGIINILEA